MSVTELVVVAVTVLFGLFFFVLGYVRGRLDRWLGTWMFARPDDPHPTRRIKMLGRWYVLTAVAVDENAWGTDPDFAGPLRYTYYPEQKDEHGD